MRIRRACRLPQAQTTGNKVNYQEESDKQKEKGVGDRAMSRELRSWGIGNENVVSSEPWIKMKFFFFFFGF